MRHRIRFYLAVLAAPFFASLAAAQERPPNIVFILADDLGWADLGCYGNKFNETPNIDRLASQGVRFTDFYAACPVCSPTRASIMSGQYQARFGLTNFIPGHWRPFEKVAPPPNALEMPSEITTCAEFLKAAGYHTAHFGKWHLGNGKAHMPPAQGFDKSIVTGGRHGSPQFRTNPKVELPKGKRLAEFLTDQTIDFMKTHKEEPFFIHLSHFAVHIPLDTTDEMLKKYQKKPKVEGYPSNPTYAGLLEEIDVGVGRIMKSLDELGLADDTLLIFTSDNGGLVKRFDAGPSDEVASSNAPLRDEKGSLYEGGIRVPLIARWPGHCQKGVTCDEPTISVDFYPTFADAAGKDPTIVSPLDGRSLLPLLQEPDKALGRLAIYWHYPHYHHSRPAGAVRAGDLKAIEFFDTGEVELYDLNKDIGESKNLADSMPDKVAYMKTLMGHWRRQVNAQMPQRNPAHNPKRAGEWWSRSSVKPVPPRP